MARRNPLGKIKDLTTETLKLPKAVAGLAVGQAKGAASAGLQAADHVSRSAAATVGSLVPHRRGPAADTPSADVEPEDSKDVEPQVEVKPDEPVNVVEELGLDPTPAARKKPAKKAPAKRRAMTSIDAAADPTAVDVTPADLAEKVAKKAPAKKAPAKKAPAKKAAAKKTATKKTAAKKPATKKTSAKKTSAAQPSVTVTSSPSGRLPARKRPLTAAELVEGAGTETITPVGTRGADVATNPDTTDTDLQQTGTAPLMDPSTTKAVASEQATLSAAADTDKH